MTDAVSLRTTVDNSYRGQHDATIIASIGDEQVGYLSYSVYNGKPAIKMVWVNPEHRRKKIALQMLKDLQNTYPDSEIDWGYTTDDGSQLKSSIKFRTQPNVDVIKAMEKLTAIRSKLKQMNYKLEKLRDTDIEAARRYSQTVSDRWNKLNDLEYHLENQLSTMGEPYSKFIDDKLNEELDVMRKLAGISEYRASSIGSNISITGTEKAKLIRKHNIRVGSDAWFKLWFSKPYLTGEKPI
jgi:hypothetical protein